MPRKAKAKSRGSTTRPRRVQRATGAADTPSQSGGVAVELRTAGRRIPLANGKIDLTRPAMQWTYVVRSRRRWSQSEELIEGQADAAREFLDGLRVSEKDLEHIAQAGEVEVSIGWSGSEEIGWAARILPWEFVIAGATHALRSGDMLTVTRHIDRKGASPVRPMHRVMFVRSEPSILKGLYDFDSERSVVKDSLKPSNDQFLEIVSPTANKLRQAVNDFRPDIVHFTGLDTHLARYHLLEDLDDQRAAARFDDVLMKGKVKSDEIWDGYVLASDDGGLGPICAQDLAATICGGSHKPQLVSLNVGNSAARIAPLIVAHGAGAAIGYQDNFNDAQSEFFYSVLYSRIAAGRTDLDGAFIAAWERVRNEPGSNQGTGIALWNSYPKFPTPSPKLASAAAKRKKLVAEAKPADVIEPGDVSSADLEKYVTVDLKEISDLNYSMLHNKRPLFDKFAVRSLKGHKLRNVHVEVSLSAGADDVSFDCSLTVDPPSADLVPRVHLPLTSAVTRSVRESVWTNLFVEVTWGQHVLCRETKRVRLTPIDQWRDNKTDGRWLPSFVFPRDPAVSRIVAMAQRYVRVLRDDPVAGFEGYQAYDPSDPDSVTEIDLQVQAIWSAIVHEMRLGYINPPPAYSFGLDSQRVRTPSMITRDNSGTCIDLALFLASCLELVDIYPVIFLLSGHAFPGYWRASDYHDEFREARPKEIQEIVHADARAVGVYGAQLEPWLLGKPTYPEIIQQIDAGRLVALEAVRLTEHCGFEEAIEAGRGNFKPKRDFEAMIDIVIAREHQVTPLPILGDQS